MGRSFALEMGSLIPQSDPRLGKSLEHIGAASDCLSNAKFRID